MDFWDNITKLVTIYMNSKSENDLEKIITLMIPYLKKYAFSAQKEAKQSGVFILFEDFFSNFMYTTWKTIKGYPQKNHSSFSNILRHRLYFSKCNVWRSYRIITDDENDKDGISYIKTRWSPLEKVDEKVLKTAPLVTQKNL